jgi:hypothetical protein
MSALADMWVMLDEAKRHVDELESVLVALVESKPVALVGYPQAEGSSEDFFVKVERPIPPEVSAIVGNCVDGYRSTLDHLVLALAISNGANLTDSDVAFPIFESRDAFHQSYKSGRSVGQPTPRSGLAKIHTLRPDAQAFIESLQPYNRPRGGSPLTELKHLHDRYEQDALNVTYYQTSTTFQAPPGVTIDHIDSRLVDGAHFGRVAYARPYPSVKVQLDVVASVGVERADQYRFIEILPYLRDRLTPFMRDEIVGEADHRFFAAS